MSCTIHPLPLGERISRPLFLQTLVCRRPKKQKEYGFELPWGVVVVAVVAAGGRYREFLLTLDFTVDALVGSGVG